MRSRFKFQTNETAAFSATFPEIRPSSDLNLNSSHSLDRVRTVYPLRRIDGSRKRNHTKTKKTLYVNDNGNLAYVMAFAHGQPKP